MNRNGFSQKGIPHVLGPLNVALAAIVWGSIGWFVNQIHLPAITITFFRVSIAALSIFAILFFSSALKNLHLRDKRTVKFVFLMSLFYTVNWVLFIQAIKLTTVTHAVLSYYTAPAFMAILGFLFLKERLDVKGLLFIAVAFAGLYLLFLPETIAGSSRISGLISGVAAGLMYAAAVVTAKPIRESLDPWTMTLFQTGIATLLLFPFMLYETGNPFGIQLSTEQWIFLVIIGLLHTTAAFALFFSGIKSISAKQVGLIMYLDPLSAVFFSKVVLNQPIDAYTIIGGILILVSGIMSTLMEERSKKNERGSACPVNGQVRR